MRITLLLLFFSLPAVFYAQSFESISLKSEVNSIWVELESLNQLRVKNSEDNRQITLHFNNHESYPEPVLIEKNDVIELKVVRTSQAIPQAQQNKYRAGQPIYPNYILEVPKNTQVKISYKQGNLEVMNFRGDLEVFLDHGIVNLENVQGSYGIQSYGGVINCALDDAQVKIESKEGSITTDIQDEHLDRGAKYLRGSYGDAVNTLRITTILGKVNLRRPEDK